MNLTSNNDYLNFHPPYHPVPENFVPKTHGDPPAPCATLKNRLPMGLGYWVLGAQPPLKYGGGRRKAKRGGTLLFSKNFVFPKVTN